MLKHERTNTTNQETTTQRADKIWVMLANVQFRPRGTTTQRTAIFVITTVNLYNSHVPRY